MSEGNKKVEKRKFSEKATGAIALVRKILKGPVKTGACPPEIQFGGDEFHKAPADDKMDAMTFVGDPHFRSLSKAWARTSKRLDARIKAREKAQANADKQLAKASYSDQNYLACCMTCQHRVSDYFLLEVNCGLIENPQFKVNKVSPLGLCSKYQRRSLSQGV
jgi:hypothetical protein